MINPSSPASGRAMVRTFCVLATLVLTVVLPAQEAAMTRGKAFAFHQGNKYGIGDRAVEADWTVGAAHVGGISILDKLHNRTVNLGFPFWVLMKDGTIYSAANLLIDGEPEQKIVTAKPGASRYAERLPGSELDSKLISEDRSLSVLWSVIVRAGSNYVRQIVTVTAPGHDLSISRVELIDSSLPGAAVVGSVKGSPIVDSDLFLGFEHPLSESNVTAGHAAAYIDRSLPLRAGQSVTYSSVVGVAHRGQMRRDFLTYLERERAHPYRTFLHYNSWYDLGRFNPYTEAGALDGLTLSATSYTRSVASRWTHFSSMMDGTITLHCGASIPEIFPMDSPKCGRPRKYMVRVPASGCRRGAATALPRKSGWSTGRCRVLRSSVTGSRSLNRSTTRASAMFAST